MKIRLYWVGKTKESWIAEGIKKYMALIKPMAQVAMVEVKEERGSASGTDEAINKESDRVLSAIKKQSGGKFILLDAGGKSLDSPGLAEFLRDMSEVEFVIGGPFGVSQQLRDAARERISLSPMTFTHQMARVVLLEQVFRALTIINRRSYHN